MNNAATGTNVPLSTFGGLSTELSPTDLPEGGCPDNQDCAFVPGSVLTRPGLARVYTNIPTTSKIVYQSTFEAKNGNTFNVLMDANGNIWSENFTQNPNVFTNIGSVPAGSKCKSVSAFGRLYMAFNDGFRGTDIPRSYDGTDINRVSQGGPAGNPVFGEFIGASVALAPVAGGGTKAITSLAASDPVTTTYRIWVEDGGFI